MALNGLICADVPLILTRSLTHSLTRGTGCSLSALLRCFFVSFGIMHPPTGANSTCVVPFAVLNTSC